MSAFPGFSAPLLKHLKPSHYNAITTFILDIILALCTVDHSDTFTCKYVKCYMAPRVKCLGFVKKSKILMKYFQTDSMYTGTFIQVK